MFTTALLEGHDQDTVTTKSAYSVPHKFMITYIK